MQQSIGSQWAHAGQLRRGDCHCVVPLCTLCTVHSLHSALLVEAFVEDEPILPRGRRGRLYDDSMRCRGTTLYPSGHKALAVVEHCKAPPGR